MLIPSESDKRLIRVIISLTEDAHGRPPTLVEITTALGYQSSSRSNIQRQLTKLRPHYVDWTEGRRSSIHVTTSGRALLGEAEIKEEYTLPISDTILPLLASGLTYLTADVANGKSFQAPFPSSWQRGLNMFVVECLLRDVDFPVYLQDALTWCSRPLNTWPVRFNLPPHLLNEPLLDEDSQPTALCREYALLKCDAELEACQQKMLVVLSEAQRNRVPQAYIEFRKFLIEHPVVSKEELMKFSFDSRISPLGSLLLDLYEQVPTLVAERGSVLICGFCGWTLQRFRGRLRCGDDRCRLLTGDFIQQKIRERSEPPEQLQRVRRAIRRYIVAPGTYEVNTMKYLQQLQLTVELWPGYDAYDLRIIFPNGTIWAIDIKDWRFPYLLAPRLTSLDRRGSLAWDRAIYTIPDQRELEQPGYLDILQNATVGQDFSVLTIRELLNQAQRYKEHTHA